MFLSAGCSSLRVSWMMESELAAGVSSINVSSVSSINVSSINVSSKNGQLVSVGFCVSVLVLRVPVFVGVSVICTRIWV